ncbi:MAG: AIR synthase family protein [Clostridiales Family XIII bacterium]|jgi:hydrogenase expression/formation protein HypE|nr:AIR synthase family protein [Clostridiales Family XIII bacterium]
MNIGKLDNDTLKRLVLNRHGATRADVLQGASVGEDCALVDFGDFVCAISSDPITATAEEIGRLSVHVSCNDIAANGIEPLGITLTVLLPPEITESEIEEMMRQASDAAAEIGVQIVGGHTEITDKVTQPIITSTAFGRALKSGLASDVCRSGDHIIVTKKLAMEGTAIIAAEKGDELRSLLPEAELLRARSFVDSISVVKEGLIAAEIGYVDMHDITEGGVLGAVWEVCTLAGVGAELEARALPFDDVTMQMCIFYDINPMRLISSGSMLIIAHPDEGTRMISALEIAGIEATKIGEVRAATGGLILNQKDGSLEVIEPPSADEIYRISS